LTIANVTGAVKRTGGWWREHKGEAVLVALFVTTLGLGTLVASGPWLAEGLESSGVLERGWGLLWQVVAERASPVQGLTGLSGVLTPLLGFAWLWGALRARGKESIGGAVTRISRAVRARAIAALSL